MVREDQPNVFWNVNAGPVSIQCWLDTRVNFPITLPSVTSLKETRDDVSWKLYMVHNANSSPELQTNMF